MNSQSQHSIFRVALLLGVLSVYGSSCAAQTPSAQSFAGRQPLEWSVRMADSEMARLGDRLAWKEGGRAKWDYTAGLFTLSLLKLNERVPNPAYVEFAKTTIGSFITPDGQIHGYTLEDYNLDNINPGKTVLALYQLTGEERYRRAAALLRKQLDTHPRTSEGGFWHKKRYPHQMWLDGLYMGGPFYAEYGKLFNEPADFDDVAKQIRLVGSHTYDPNTGLFYHGWDESKEQDWANKITGTSPCFWGRAIGWYGMALVDDLDFFPANHPARGEIIAMLKKLCDGVVKHQDPNSGLWYQVVDQGTREGNYLEATASSMFVYTMAKAMNRGYLSRDYIPATVKGYQGIVEELLRTDDEGRVSLTQCCSVAGLGYGRDGSYAYYLKEPVVTNDLKGVGPFILAGIELQDLLALPSTIKATSEPSEATTPAAGKDHISPE
jgi:unsaturated rhamnogalacturonyl hydrolase